MQRATSERQCAWKMKWWVCHGLGAISPSGELRWAQELFGRDIAGGCAGIKPAPAIFFIAGQRPCDASASALTCARR